MKFLLALTLFLTSCTHAEKSTTPNQGAPMTFVRMELKDPPLLGTTAAGQKFYLGGFSGLRFLGERAGKLRFLTLTDRGPNADESEVGSEVQRPFLLPEFQPRLVYLEADPVAGTLKVEKEIFLKRPDGKKVSGIPPKTGHQEVPLNSVGKLLAQDTYGMDPEGVALEEDGSFWVAEEYGPSVARFSKDGKWLDSLKPGSGLPKVLSQRQLNRGFEGMALFQNRLYLIMQSPLDNPISEKEKNGKRSVIVRIIEVDTKGRRTLGQYAYVLDHRKVDKIGDITVDGPRSLLVIERDGKTGAKAVRKVFHADLTNATNLQLLPERIVGPGGTLESMTAEDLKEAGIVPVQKKEVLDLASIAEEKIEGIEILHDGRLAFVIDNDFALDGSWDKSSGKVGTKPEVPAIYLFPKSAWNP